MHIRHLERHVNSRIAWLRAAVLGANDGIVSTASLVIGIAAAKAEQPDILLAGIAALVAGSMSMAAGEYVSVSSQADAEKADIEREKYELAHDLEFERKELAAIYHKRGIEKELAMQVAEQLMAHDALGAHLRDELGIIDVHRAQPILAAVASAISFATGAALPVVLVAIVPMNNMIPVISGSSLAFLVLLGSIAAKVGGASLITGAGRVAFWGALAMAATAVIGHIFGNVGI